MKREFSDQKTQFWDDALFEKYTDGTYYLSIGYESQFSLPFIRDNGISILDKVSVLTMGSGCTKSVEDVIKYLPNVETVNYDTREYGVVVINIKRKDEKYDFEESEESETQLRITGKPYVMENAVLQKYNQWGYYYLSLGKGYNKGDCTLSFGDDYAEKMGVTDSMMKRDKDYAERVTARNVVTISVNSEDQFFISDLLKTYPRLHKIEIDGKPLNPSLQQGGEQE